ncbi:hypothetical protein C8R45DRAFT_942798 [Mycena sanguinolenta]|nr:hypothetical protein C8R45DRAFT_942798 [Mycena sanguinolenta]
MCEEDLRCACAGLLVLLPLPPSHAYVTNRHAENRAALASHERPVAVVLDKTTAREDETTAMEGKRRRENKTNSKRKPAKMKRKDARKRLTPPCFLRPIRHTRASEVRRGAFRTEGIKNEKEEEKLGQWRNKKWAGQVKRTENRKGRREKKRKGRNRHAPQARTGLTIMQHAERSGKTTSGAVSGGKVERRGAKGGATRMREGRVQAAGRSSVVFLLLVLVGVFGVGIGVNNAASF